MIIARVILRSMDYFVPRSENYKVAMEKEAIKHKRESLVNKNTELEKANSIKNCR